MDAQNDLVIALNKILREVYNLWVVHDEHGWHEHMSLDYFDNPSDAFRDAFEYGKALESGIKRIDYF